MATVKPDVVDVAIATYAADHSTAPDDVQRALIAETEALVGVSRMQIGGDQGVLLEMLARTTGARRAIEIGTFTGYSALSIARGLGPAGRLLCCDVSEVWTAIAQRAWEAAGVRDRIDLRIAPALDTLKTLKGKFDFAFIDADKTNYQNYFERCLRLVRRGGLIAIDNTLWHGKVIDRRDQTADTRAIRAFNRKLRRDRRVDISLVPIGDGLTLAVKR